MTLDRVHATERPRVEKPVYHFGASLAPGEHLDREQKHANRSLADPGLAEDASPHRLANARVLLDEARERFALLEHRRAALRLVTLQGPHADPDDLAQAAGVYRETEPVVLTPDPAPAPELRAPGGLFPERLVAQSPKPLQALLNAYEERIDHHRQLSHLALSRAPGPDPDRLARSLRHHDAAELLSREVPYLSRASSDYLYLRRIYREDGPGAVYRAAAADPDLGWLTRSDPYPPVWEADFPEAGERVLTRLQDDLARRLRQTPTHARQVEHVRDRMKPFLEQVEQRLSTLPPGRGAGSKPLAREDLYEQLADPPRSLLPGQLERLRISLARLESFDRLEAQRRRLAQSRHALPLYGSLPDLRRAARETPRPLEVLERHAPEIYRDPAAAVARLRAVLERDPSSTLERLASEPQTFGRLRGAGLAGRSTALREQALASVRQALVEIRQHARERTSLHQAYRSAHNLCSLQRDLRAQQQRLAPSRDRLLARIASQSVALEPSTLRAHLSRTRAEMVEALRRLHRRHLEPLRQAVRRSRAALGQMLKSTRHANASTRRAVAMLHRPVYTAARRRLTSTARRSLAAVHQLSRVVRQGPRYLIYRLTPPQVALAVTVAKLGNRLVRDPSPERAEDLGR